MRPMVVLATFVALGLACGASQLGPGEYAAALQGCIAKAKASDGGMPAYERCAQDVDQTFRGDGGVR